jgi:membrane fusion protein (multidrug efflux system)
MNRTHWIKKIISALLLLALGIGIGHWFAHKSGAPPAQADESGNETNSGPVAQVTTVPLKRGQIKAVEVTYGTVMAAPGETHTFSVPYESRVKVILIAPGQVIQTNAPLIEVEPSPDTRLQLDQARNERDSAKKSFELVQQRAELKLATRQEQLQSQQQLDAAELKVRSLEARGIENSQTLRADASGVVSEIAVQPGQIVAAGAPLLNTIGQNQIIVRLGLESEVAGRVQEDQAVELRAVNGPATQTVPGKIRFIASRVNPQTRLVDVFVGPDAAAHFVLNEYVRGVIAIAAHEAWVVPRAAVLPEDDHEIIYTADNGHAVKHVVALGLQNDQEVEVIGKDLKAGELVVVVGNSQLEPGMTVHEGAKP